MYDGYHMLKVVTLLSTDALIRQSSDLVSLMVPVRGTQGNERISLKCDSLFDSLLAVFHFR